MMLSITVSAFGIITEGHQHDVKGFFPDAAARDRLQQNGCKPLAAGRKNVLQFACSKVLLLFRALE